MLHFKKTLVIFVFSFLSGFGSLTWENQAIELVAKPHDAQLTGVFRFSNTGNSPVTITSLQPSCGCTTVELTKKTYLPSETGEVKVIYTVHEATGWQHKTIAVTTDDATVKPVQLTLRINIPELLTCQPRVLLWHIGEKPEDKKTVISAVTNLKIAQVEILAVSPDKNAIARLEHDQASDQYTLWVHPTSAQSIEQVGISCRATFSDGATQTFSVFALVR